ncbi:MAG: SIR2 family NAD-dependent protein deacylase [Gemmatimonadaceae bacterium]
MNIPPSDAPPATGESPHPVPWAPGQSRLPTGGELSRYLADAIEFPSRDPHETGDLSQVASYYLLWRRRDVLQRELRDALDVAGRSPAPLGAAHEYLAEVAKAATEEPLLIVTTNYDEQMERALRIVKCACDVVAHASVGDASRESALIWHRHGEALPRVVTTRELDRELDPSSRTVLYKMHGALWKDARQFDRFVISEEDYTEFLGRMTLGSLVPKTLGEQFQRKEFLFMGYGLRDWNLRTLLWRLRTRAPITTDPGGGATPLTVSTEDTLGWAVQRGPTQTERDLWLKRGVKVVDMDLAAFVDALRDAYTR